MTGTDRAASSTPELQLLLAFLREGSGPAAGTGTLEPFSAERLVELATLHGLGAWLLERLSAVPHSPRTEEVLGHLAPAVSRRLRVGLQLSAELLAVLDLLRGQGIPAIPYKGPVLACELYGSPGMRSYRDLDLLLRAEDLSKARELLAQRDYRALHPIPPRFEAAHLASGYHYNLVRDRDGMLLELHWRVADPYFSTLGADELLWQGLREVPFLGRTVPSLAPETLLLCLAVHGAKHHWDQLSHVVDIAALVRAHPNLDAGRLVDAAERSGSLRRLRVALRLAERLAGCPPSVAWQAWMDDPAAARLADEFVARLMTERLPAPGLLTHARIDLAGMERPSDRNRYLRGILAPNVSDWVSSPLPPVLSPLLPLLRPFRLLRRYGLFHRSRSDD